jgi:signal transduction histidine kinase/ActR/RegA family two-component response regulator
VHNDETALVRQRDEAQAASAMKSAFVANLSHEIRTPLNVVLGASELLATEDMGPQQRELIASIETAGRQLLELVDDVMDLARIEAGRIGLEEEVFEPRLILNDLSRAFVYIADDAGMELAFTVGVRLDVEVAASRRHIRQVAANLMGNALKHAGGTRIETKMRLGKARAPAASDPDQRALHTLIIEVSDDGVGVADAHKARIFGRFVKGGPEAALREARRDWEAPHGVVGPASHGSGLGLTIARMVCAAHGGELRVSDTPGGGATFTAAFDVRAAEVAPMAAAPPSGAAMLRGLGRPLRLLVAEDSAMNADIMRRALALAPTEVDFVSDGREALARLQDKSYDAVMLDIRMPRLSGLEVLEAFEALRRTDGRDRPIFIACTAHAMTSQRRAYAEAGFDLQVVKPYRLKDIADALADVCARLDAGEISCAAP